MLVATILSAFQASRRIRLALALGFFFAFPDVRTLPVVRTSGDKAAVVPSVGKWFSLPAAAANCNI